MGLRPGPLRDDLAPKFGGFCQAALIALICFREFGENKKMLACMPRGFNPQRTPEPNGRITK